MAQQNNNGKFIYKVYVHDCYHTGNSNLSSSDEELNAILDAGWEIDKFSAGITGDGVCGVLLLRRWQDGGTE